MAHLLTSGQPLTSGCLPGQQHPGAPPGQVSACTTGHLPSRPPKGAKKVPKAQGRQENQPGCEHGLRGLRRGAGVGPGLAGEEGNGRVLRALGLIRGVDKGAAGGIWSSYRARLGQQRGARPKGHYPEDGR